MINATPRSVPLPNEYYARGVTMMRAYGANLLDAAKLWDIIRDYSENDWPSVLLDMKRDDVTGKWFS
jgi:hypothetical protein